MNQVQEGFNATVISASTVLKAKPGILGGIFVSSTTAGTLTIYDTAAADTANNIVAVFTPVTIGFYRIPCGFANGLRVVVANTISCTVFWT